MNRTRPAERRLHVFCRVALDSVVRIQTKKQDRTHRSNLGQSYHTTARASYHTGSRRDRLFAILRRAAEHQISGTLFMSARTGIERNCIHLECSCSRGRSPPAHRRPRRHQNRRDPESRYRGSCAWCRLRRRFAIRNGRRTSRARRRLWDDSRCIARPCRRSEDLARKLQRWFGNCWGL